MDKDMRDLFNVIVQRLDSFARNVNERLDVMQADVATKADLAEMRADTLEHNIRSSTSFHTNRHPHAQPWYPEL